MIENKSAKYEKSIRIKSVFTQEDNERNPDAIIGMEYTYIPLVDTPKEAFERLHKLTGQNLSEWYQKHFYKTYPVINLDIINSEITDLENFITEANKLLIKDAFRSDAIKYHNSPFYLKEEQYEYLRLTNHYYKTHICDYLQSKITCQVYGKYVLYYDWLKKLREKYETPILQEDVIKEDATKEDYKIKIKVYEEAFAFMQGDDPRKHKQILDEKDYNNLVKWVSFYFENNLTLPKIETPIKRVNTSKGNVVYTFMKLFKIKYPKSPRPNSLYELIKLCFYDYREDNIKNLSKTKMPQYYEDLIDKYK